MRICLGRPGHAVGSKRTGSDERLQGVMCGVDQVDHNLAAGKVVGLLLRMGARIKVSNSLIWPSSTLSSLIESTVAELCFGLLFTEKN